MNLRKYIKFYANICIACFAFLTHVHAEQSLAAGEVTFTLGKSYLNGKELILVGSKIREGDVIETLGNGHVHIRFVDDGLISIRPDSRFMIEHYAYNANEPNQSVIKFDLAEGVMRSISGTGAKAARDKFRLNTPIAAIGVRGTDFVANSSHGHLKAIVNEGAIIVAPFSQDCQISELGPCQSNNVVLSSLSNQFLEYSTVYDSPKLLPLSTSVKNKLYIVSSNTQDSSDIESEDDSPRVLEQSSSLIAETSALNSYKAVEKANRFPILPLNEGSKRQIVWGRFGEYQDHKFMSVYDFATASFGRNTGVHANMEKGLLTSYRPYSEREIINPNLGNVDFQLMSAEALLSNQDGINEAVAITNGFLTINFPKNQFNTQLELFHPSANESELNVDASGDVSRLGVLNSSTPNESVMGITTFEGDESSYFFSKDTSLGTVEGITYWRNQ